MKTLIKNAQVIFTVPEVEARAADILIEDGLITSVKAPKDAGADRVLDAAGKILMPGLINTHTHAYMSIFRNYADDLPFDEWLFKKLMPVEDRMTPEQAYWCNLLSCLEMIRSGTTCFLDMHMFKNQCVRAAEESGMRAVLSRGLSAESREDPGGQRRLNEALEEMEEAKGGSGRVTFMLGPHAIYTCDTGFLADLIPLAKEKGLGFHIHLSETRFEVESCLEKNGCTPAQLLERIDFFSVPTVAAHCVHMTDNDLSILARRGVSVASNPLSNMKLGNGFAPAQRILDAGINLAIGTDGAASNNNLNMIKEMAVFAMVHKGTSEDVLALPAKQVLRCGTVNGARALGLGDKTGAIEVGRRADLVLLDTRCPQMQPLGDPVAAVVYSASGAEVDTVLIDGEVVMENREVKTIDKERVYQEISRIQDELL